MTLNVKWSNVIKTIISSIIYMASSTSLNFLMKWQVADSSWRYPGFFLCVQFGLTAIILNGLLLITNALRITHYELINYKLFGKQSIIGLLTTLDYAISNTSLSYISVTYYVIAKASSPIFIFAFGLLFKQEKFSIYILSGVILITIGIFISSVLTTSFNLTGLIFILVSNTFTALRMIYIQYILHQGGVTTKNLQSMNVGTLAKVIHQAMLVDDSDEGGPPQNSSIELEDLQDDSDASSHSEKVKTATHKKEKNKNIKKNRTTTTTSLEEFELSETEEEEDSQTDEETDEEEIDLLETIKPENNKKGIAYVEPSTLLTVRYMMMSGSISCIPFVYLFESNGMMKTLEVTPFSNIIRDILIVLTITITFGFVLNVSEFFVIESSTTMTATIVGILKQFVVIGIDIAKGGETFNIYIVVGFLTTMVGVILYNIHRYKQIAEKQQLNVADPSIDDYMLTQYVLAPAYQQRRRLPID